jgi:hypothetical protein
MLDLEAFIVRGGIVVLASMSIIRLIVFDFNNLVNDFRQKRRRR